MRRIDYEILCFKITTFSHSYVPFTTLRHQNLNVPIDQAKFHKSKTENYLLVLNAQIHFSLFGSSLVYYQ